MNARSAISPSCWKTRAGPYDRRRLISTSASADCESLSIMKVRDARSSTASSREDPRYCHSCESGNPSVLETNLDSGFRGNDDILLPRDCYRERPDFLSCQLVS